MKEVYKLQRKKIEDSRGWFLKVIEGNEVHNPFPCEVYITSAKPGESKGGHYHKKAKEWFTIIKGQAEATLVDVRTGERNSFSLSENDTITLFVPGMVAHNFKNNSKNEDFILLAYSDMLFDKNDTIPFILK